MNRSSSRLADGRELIYYDDSGGVLRDAVDTRSLPLRELPTEVRFDVVFEEWVTVKDAMDGCPGT